MKEDEGRCEKTREDERDDLCYNLLVPTQWHEKSRWFCMTGSTTSTKFTSQFEYNQSFKASFKLLSSYTMGFTEKRRL